jgi:2-keto-4-pentenoate hydratase
MNNVEDPRIVEGMRRQGELLGVFRARGARLMGFKAGLGAPQARRLLKLTAPVAGFLTDETAVADGGSVSVSGWRQPTFEAELAVRLGSGLEAGATAADALVAIDAIAPAIELVDPGSPADLAAVLAADVFHRAYAIGSFAPAEHWPVDVARLSITVDGVSRGADIDPAAELGPVGETVARLADQVGLAGCAMTVGDVIITGSVVPAIALPGAARLEVTLVGGASVSISVGS